LAAKVVIRTTDGLSLSEAMHKSMAEAKENKRDLGAIALSRDGKIVWGKTSEILLAAYHDGNGINDSLEWNDDSLTDSI